MKRVTLQRSALLVLGTVLLQLAFWLSVARENVHGYAWAYLAIHHIEDVEEDYLPQCIAVEASLQARTPPRLMKAVASAAAARGLQVRTAEPTLAPPNGYADRECVEYFLAPAELDGRNFPLLADPSVAYYSYDFNGDAVLMAQLGPIWVYLHHWNRWF